MKKGSKVWYLEHHSGKIRRGVVLQIKKWSKGFGESYLIHNSKDPDDVWLNQMWVKSRKD